MSTALVTGAHGFIGGHLVDHLKERGYWVRGVDVKPVPDFGCTPNYDEFLHLDLRNYTSAAVAINGRCTKPVDEVYQLAADMGGMGFIEYHETDVLTNNNLINTNMMMAAIEAGVDRYFFSSSVCVYKDMSLTDVNLRMAYGYGGLNEDEAYPAQPDNEYGWEKLYAERMALAYARQYPIEVRIARFQNTYGVNSDYKSFRAKAPAALCYKAAMAEDGDVLRVWGDGTATRGFTHIDDLVDGICIIMDSDEERPVNLGTDKFVTVEYLADCVVRASGKNLHIVYDTDQPTGVSHRLFSHSRANNLGIPTNYFIELRDGIDQLYDWVESQV